MPFNSEDGKIILLMILAGVGGFLRYVSQAIKMKQPVRMIIGLTRGGTAAIVGYIVLQVCQSYSLSSELTGALTALSGLVGADSMIPIIEVFVKRRLGISDISYFHSPYDGPERRKTDNDE